MKFKFRGLRALIKSQTGPFGPCAPTFKVGDKEVRWFHLVLADEFHPHWFWGEVSGWRPAPSPQNIHLIAFGRGHGGHPIGRRGGPAGPVILPAFPLDLGGDATRVVRLENKGRVRLAHLVEAKVHFQLPSGEIVLLDLNTKEELPNPEAPCHPHCHVGRDKEN